MAGTGIIRYLDIKERIIQKINNGEYPVGSMLPSEDRLAEIFHVSRGTIRQALNALEKDALIARRSGVGTQVLRPAKMPNVVSFTAQIQSKGMQPGAQILHKTAIPASQADGRVMEAFNIAPEQAENTSVLWIDRLRLADDHPVAHQEIYLLASDFQPGVLENQDFQNSIFKLYDQSGRHITWADEIIRARNPSEDEVHMLHLEDLPETDRLVYERNRISYDEKNMPLEVLVSIERADFFERYRYTIRAD